MSEEHVSPTEDPPSTDTSTNASESTDTGAGGTTDGRLSGDVARYVNYLLLAGLAVLVLVAGAQFYGAVGRTIDQWVVREYRSLFHAAFNLATLLVALGGVSWQLRRLRW